MNINLVKHGVLLAAVLIGVSLSLPAAAQSHGGGRGQGGGNVHGGGGGHGSNVRGGGGWRGGNLRGGGGGGWHGGGPGWWGVGLGLGLGWDAAYFGYPYPDYPNPAYYTPYSPPAVIIEPSPEGTPSAVPPNSPPASNWYYCDSAKAYYPYVTQCPEPWRVVPAVPPGTVR